MIKSNECEKCMHYEICKYTELYKEKIGELLKLNNTNSNFIISIDCKHFGIPVSCKNPMNETARGLEKQDKQLN